MLHPNNGLQLDKEPSSNKKHNQTADFTQTKSYNQTWKLVPTKELQPYQAAHSNQRTTTKHCILLQTKSYNQSLHRTPNKELLPNKEYLPNKELQPNTAALTKQGTMALRAPPPPPPPEHSAWGRAHLYPDARWCVVHTCIAAKSAMRTCAARGRVMWQHQSVTELR